MWAQRNRIQHMHAFKNHILATTRKDPISRLKNQMRLQHREKNQCNFKTKSVTGRVCINSHHQTLQSSLMQSNLPVMQSNPIHPIQSNPIQSNPIQSNPIPFNPNPIQSLQSNQPIHRYDLFRSNSIDSDPNLNRFKPAISLILEY